MATNKIRIEDDAGNIFHPHTTTDVVFRPDGSSLESALTTYKDILNLSATPAGVITWALPTATDGTRTAIVLCRASKDISNMDYAACLADASITKNTLAQNATSNTYSGLTNSTQYWVKAFVKYALGGKEFYSGGVTVTFTYVKPVVITEFYNAGNEFTAVTGGWIQSMSTHPPITYFTKNPNDITIGIATTTSTSVNVSATRPTNKIDFTNISKIKAECEIYDGVGSGQLYIAITDQPDGWGGALAITSSTQMVAPLQTYEINTVNMTGLHYYGISAICGYETGKKRNIRITRVWGES